MSRLALALVAALALPAVGIGLLPDCALEDSHNCRWDASLQGNGFGTSFIDIGGFVFAAPALAAPNLPPLSATPQTDDAPAYWLIELVPGVEPGAYVVDDYADAAACFRAALSHELERGDFAVCVPLDERAEMRLFEFGAREYGLTSGTR